jgi:hypothetical protein
MKTTGGLVSETIERAKARMLESRQVAGDQLLELLRRNDQPEPDDERKLVALAEQLGIRMEQLPEILALVQTLDGYEAMLASEGELKDQAFEALQAIAAIDAETAASHARIDREAEEKRRPHEQKQGTAKGRLQRISVAQRWIDNARRNWRAVVNGTGEAWMKMRD